MFILGMVVGLVIGVGFTWYRMRRRPTIGWKQKYESRILNDAWMIQMRGAKDDAKP